jgi:hypothetical protein
MALKTLFIPLDQTETKNSRESGRDKYDRYEEKTKKFDSRQVEGFNQGENSVINKLNAHLNAYNEKTNTEGGYSIVSVTPVLATETSKVDRDEPLMPLVHTTGFLVILHKEGR